MRSLNKVELIGNLTRDPEFAVTGTGVSVCNFSVATDRSWKTDKGDKHEETEFHRVVAWQKLAELCRDILKKSAKVYCQGRLSSRKYIDDNGIERLTTEIILEDMICLDKKDDTVSKDAV